MFDETIDTSISAEPPFLFVNNDADDSSNEVDRESETTTAPIMAKSADQVQADMMNAFNQSFLTNNETGNTEKVEKSDIDNQRYEQSNYVHARNDNRMNYGTENIERTNTGQSFLLYSAFEPHQSSQVARSNARIREFQTEPSRSNVWQADFGSVGNFAVDNRYDPHHVNVHQAAQHRIDNRDRSFSVQQYQREFTADVPADNRKIYSSNHNDESQHHVIQYQIIDLNGSTNPVTTNRETSMSRDDRAFSSGRKILDLSSVLKLKTCPQKTTNMSDVPIVSFHNQKNESRSETKKGYKKISSAANKLTDEKIKKHTSSAISEAKKQPKLKIITYDLETGTNDTDQGRTMKSNQEESAQRSAKASIKRSGSQMIHNRNHQESKQKSTPTEAPEDNSSQAWAAELSRTYYPNGIIVGDKNTDSSTFDATLPTKNIAPPLKPDPRVTDDSESLFGLGFNVKIERGPDGARLKTKIQHGEETMTETMGSKSKSSMPLIKSEAGAGFVVDKNGAEAGVKLNTEIEIAKTRYIESTFGLSLDTGVKIGKDRLGVKVFGNGIDISTKGLEIASQIGRLRLKF